MNEEELKVKEAIELIRNYCRSANDCRDCNTLIKKWCEYYEPFPYYWRVLDAENCDY